MATATAPARARAEARPLQTPGAPAPRRTTPAPSRPTPSAAPRRALVLCFTLVVGSLLSVVAADAYLTQGQVRLTRLQEQLNTDLGRHRDLELEVAQRSSPSKVVGEARHHGLVAPDHVSDLPQASVSDTSATTTAPAPGATSDQATTGP